MLTAEQELFWNMYLENATQGRHYEVQRSNVTGFVMIVATALIGIAVHDDTLSGWSDFIEGLFVCFVGLFGAAFAMKHSEKYRLTRARAAEYCKLLDNSLGSPLLSEAKRAGDKAHCDEWKRLSRTRSKYWWVALHIVVMVIGIALMAGAAIDRKPVDPGLGVSRQPSTSPAAPDGSSTAVIPPKPSATKRY